MQLLLCSAILRGKVTGVQRKRSLLLLAGTTTVVVMCCVWFALLPQTPAHCLARARRTEEKLVPEVAALKLAADQRSTDKAHDLVVRMLVAYAEVATRFPRSPEAEEAAFRALEISDQNTSAPEARLALVRGFLQEYPQSLHAADLRWREAEITHRDIKSYLEAIRLYETFASDFAKDSRAAEAVFRIGAIYEEVREFGAAKTAYDRVVSDYPASHFADEAQFRVANLLADRLEKRQEAIKAFEKLEKDYPKSRLTTAAAGQRQRLEQARAVSERDKYRHEYYGGVGESSFYDRVSEELNSPAMQRLRAQGLDLVHESIVTTIPVGEHPLSATAALSVVPGDRTDGSVVVQLGKGIALTSVTRAAAPAKFSHQGNFVFIELGGRAMERGVTETLVFSYSRGGSAALSGATTAPESIMGFGRDWIPVLNLGDSFTADIALAVPEGWLALTQGRLLDTTTWLTTAPTASALVYRYSMGHPAYYYGFAAAPYVARKAHYESRTESGGTRPLPITVALLPETTASYFDAYAKELPEILAFFESRLGPYPYPELAVAQVRGFPGGLGTPGLILVGDPGFEKDGAPASFLAHEVAHTWFGNELTLDLSDGSIPWLAEGFAQYWDSLYLENQHGSAALTRHMRSLAANYYSAAASVLDKPVSGTLMADPMYASLVYDKGAFILHALRWVMGTDNFFAAMRQYVEANRGHIVDVPQFQRQFELVHGQPLGWFFAEWLERTGIPHYILERAYQLPRTDGSYRVEVVVRQADTPYRMPVELAVVTADGMDRRVVDIGGTVTTATIETRAEPLRIILDPDYWILKHPRTSETERAVTADTTP